MPSFLSFELGISRGEVSKVGRERSRTAHPLEDAFAWFITVADDQLVVYALVDGRIQQIGTAQVRGGRLHACQGRSPEFPNDHQWSLVENGLAVALGHRGPAWSGRRLPVRHLVCIGVALAIVGAAVAQLVSTTAQTGFPLHGAHVVGVPLAVLFVAGAIAGGSFALSSRRVRSEPERRDPITGKRSLGPLTSSWSALIVTGLLVAIYPCSALRDRPSDAAATRAAATAPPPAVATPATATAPPPATATPATATVAPAPPPTFEAQLAAAPDLPAAIALAKPRFGDGADDAGAWALAEHASKRLRWADFAIATPETTVPHVLKDSDLERGKRLCVAGRLLDIERRDRARRPVYVGALATTDGDVARFIAVGSTGELVKRSTARLCGVVTGRADKAVMLVGMFELPENQQPTVER